MVKAREVSRQYGLDAADFDRWLQSSGVPIKAGFTGTVIDDSVPLKDLLVTYQADVAEREKRTQADAAEREERERANARLVQEREAREKQAQADFQAAVKAVVATTGDSLMGVAEVEYVEIVSTDVTFSVDRETDGVFFRAQSPGDAVSSVLSELRAEALLELKAEAVRAGANAVLGISFENLIFGPETANSQGGTTYQPYVFGVSAVGTAVRVN